MSGTWTLVNSGYGSLSSISCARNGQTTITNGQTLIGILYYNNTMYYSNNYGSTINQSSTTFSGQLSFPIISTYVNGSTNIVYVIVSYNQIYISNNGGQTYTLYSTITGLTGIANFITCDINGSNIFISWYIVGGGSGQLINNYLYKYSNSTWSQIYSITTTSNGYIWLKLISSSNGQYLYGIYKYDIGVYNIVVSTDYGNTFNSYTLPNSGTDEYTNITCNSTGSIIYAASNYGIYKSTNNGLLWNLITTGLSGGFIDISTDSTGMGVVSYYKYSISNDSYSGIYYSTNGGSSWNNFDTTQINRNSMYGPNGSMYGLNGTVSISSNGKNVYANVVSLGLYSYTPPIICFHESTKILTDTGYRSIRDLRKGDLIQTADHGFVPIEIIGRREIYHPANTQDRIKDQLYLCSRYKYSNTPIFEDLILTGCNSILVKQFNSDEQRDQTEKLLGDIYITDNHYRLPACLDHRSSVYDKPGDYTIYHFALENRDYYMNYGVYANGLLVESSSRRLMNELSNMEILCD